MRSEILRVCVYIYKELPIEYWILEIEKEKMGKLKGTFSLNNQIILQKNEKNLHFYAKNLCICKFCCTFAANFDK